MLQRLPLHHIRDLLGHADISTTSRYLSVTPTELQRSMQIAEERQRQTKKARGQQRSSSADRGAGGTPDRAPCLFKSLA